MELKPIKNDADLDMALAEMTNLWGSGKDTVDGDRLEVIALLVDAYETKNYPISPPNPVDAIKFRMEQSKLTRRDLEPYIGGKSRVSEILNCKRNLSLRMIRNLHNGLNIPLKSLISVQIVTN